MSNIREFFAPSDFMEHEVLRPLSHIRANWELQIDPKTGCYLEEEDSFAALFNALIDELETTHPPTRYHDNEDRLGEHVQKHLNWKIRKSGGTWVNQDGSQLHPTDYLALLEQGGFDNQGIHNLGREGVKVGKGSSLLLTLNHFQKESRADLITISR
jgi:hypothetical protein